MATDEIRGDRIYLGTVSFGGTLNMPSGGIANVDVNAAAAIAATKLVHRQSLSYGQVDGTDVITATQGIHLCRAAATLISVEVRPDTAPTGGDKQFTVDVKKATNAGSYATVLSSAIVLNSSSVDDTLQTGTLSVTALADGDAVQVVITASGSSGSQGQGFVVTVNLDESPS